MLAMTTLIEILSQTKKIFHGSTHRVERTVAEELKERCAPGAQLVRLAKTSNTVGGIRIAVEADPKRSAALSARDDRGEVLLPVISST